MSVKYISKGDPLALLEDTKMHATIRYIIAMPDSRYLSTEKGDIPH